MKIKTCFSQKPLGHFQQNFVCKLLGTLEMKIHLHEHDQDGCQDRISFIMVKTV